MPPCTITVDPSGRAVAIRWPALGLELIVGREAAFWWWGNWSGLCERGDA